jgi:N-acyl-D-aspartate/D-glutamate deacylase
MARYPHTSLQIIARDTEDTKRLLRMAGPRGVRVLRSTGGPEDDGHLLQAMIDAGGWDVWRLGGGSAPFAPSLGFDSSIGTAAVTAWHEMVNGPADRKLALLADGDWRARARHDWDHPLPEQNSFKDLDIFVLSDSENGTGPVDITLEDLARARGLHPSDALADWILANGIGSRYHKKRFGLLPELEEKKVRDGIADPNAVMGATDAGAHVHMFCGGGGNAYMLTHWCKERGVPVEQAVHCLTGRTASFFSLADRGVIDVGRRGDLAVFALDEIEIRSPKRVHDLPDGGWRFSRPPAGFRATVVAGVPTVIDGEPTGAMPAAVGSARISAAGG